MENIKELDKTFVGIGQVKGFKFSQISKTDCGFLYEVDTVDTIYYEVFKRRINRRFARISYPTNKAFGIWAWTTPDKNKAYQLLDNLCTDIQDKN